MKENSENKYILYILIYNYLYNKTEENKEKILNFLVEKGLKIESFVNELTSKFFTQDNDKIFGDELISLIKFIIDEINPENLLTEEDLWLFKYVNVSISRGIEEDDLQAIIENGITLLENEKIPFAYKKDLYSQIIFLISRKPTLENLEKANKYLEIIKKS